MAFNTPLDDASIQLSPIVIVRAHLFQRGDEAHVALDAVAAQRPRRAPDRRAIAPAARKYEADEGIVPSTWIVPGLWYILLARRLHGERLPAVALDRHAEAAHQVSA